MQKPDASAGHRVMQSATRLERVIDLATQDAVDRLDRTTRDGGRRLVHAVERRAVARSDPGMWRQERIVGERLDRVDVIARVQSGQLVVGRDTWREEVGGSNGAHEVDGRPEPSGRERMLVAEVVGQAYVAIDD